jgi:electron transport complex protein RnfC
MDSPTSSSSPWPALREIEMPARVFVPLDLEVREVSSLPLGTRVRAGDALVQDAGPHEYIPVAPAAGTVGAVRMVRLTHGRDVLAMELTIEPDSQSPSAPSSPESRESFSEWIDLLCELGVTAGRHTSPDLLGQLRGALAGPIDTVICSVLDSDSALPLSSILAARYTADLIAGVTLLAKITGASRAIVASEVHADATFPDPLRGLGTSSDIRFVNLANAYPQSDPTLMLYSLAHRRLAPGHLPNTLGVLLLDAAAAVAIGQAQQGKAMLRVPMAIHDHILHRTHFLSVPVGASVSDVLSACGILPEQKILRGGDLLRDVRIRGDAVIAGAELTIHITAPEPPENPDPCIRSGWCLDVCPTRVHPAVILEAAQRQDAGMADRAGIHACIECGLCTHVCPSRLPLLEAVRELRATLNPL